MATSGSNLPEFRSVQLDFAGHIRDPENIPVPVGIEPRRMQIYADLFFNNIKSFLDSAFPVARQIVGEAGWHRLAREFLHVHGSESPYFLQISEEFLTFLYVRGLDGLPPFLLELCHYEWVELALDVAVEEVSEDSFDANGPLSGVLICSPLVKALAYGFPVHKIGIDHQPQTEPEMPTFLLVYRNPQLEVRFVESNPVTHRLLELLTSSTVEDALEQIKLELTEAGRSVSAEQISRQGLQTLTHLHDLGIILGPKVVSS